MKEWTYSGPVFPALQLRLFLPKQEERFMSTRYERIAELVLMATSKGLKIGLLKTTSLMRCAIGDLILRPSNQTHSA